MPIQQMLVGVGKAEVFAEATGGTVTTVGDYKAVSYTHLTLPTSDLV